MPAIHILCGYSSNPNNQRLGHQVYIQALQNESRHNSESSATVACAGYPPSDAEKFRPHHAVYQDYSVSWKDLENEEQSRRLSRPCGPIPSHPHIVRTAPISTDEKSSESNLAISTSRAWRILDHNQMTNRRQERQVERQ